MDQNNTTKSNPSEAEILAEFKKTFITEGSIVLDAWIVNGFIQYHLDPERFFVDGKRNNPVPFEFMGMDTLLTLFPRDND